MSKPVILCVDDEDIVLSSIKEQLKSQFKQNVDVEIIDSGEKALELLSSLIDSKLEIPLVISDQLMPGIKGDQLLTKVHSISPKTLNILLTGQANAEDVGRSLNTANLYRFISKPWAREDLLLTVKEALHRYFQDKTLFEQNGQLESLNEMLRRKVEIFNKFVPKEFLKLLASESDKDHIELGQCAERVLSVMFSDVHSFTLICESLPLQDIFEFINRFLANATPYILKHQGFIDKFVGDAVMALFTDPDHALQSAIDMHQYILSQEDENSAIPCRIGISVNTGPVMIGTIGNETRMETTVLGDTVNIAARIEKLTKRYRTPLLITENTVNSLINRKKYNIRNIDKVTVRGGQEPIEIFEVLDALPEEAKEKKVATLAMFNQARFYYLQRKYLEAKRLFNECLILCPEDEVTRIYINRIEG